MAITVIKDNDPATPDRVLPAPEVSRRFASYPRRDTKPELALRRLLFGSGLRYRVQYPVPGRPRRKIDIAFTRAKVAIFVDGCFWHGCDAHASIPSTNHDWWKAKIDHNRDRDRETDAILERSEWLVIRVWEHANFSEAAEFIEAEVVRRRVLLNPGSHTSPDSVPDVPRQMTASR